VNTASATTLVVGATGLLGEDVCRRLRAANSPVRALVRRQSPKAAALRAIGAEIVEGDLKDVASLDAACRGARAVVSTANAIASRRRGDSLETVDRDGQLALLAAATRAGVAHFIYVSLSPDLAANNPFIRYKRQVEAAVRASGIGWTIMQPSAFMEIHTGTPLGWDFHAGRARVLGSGRTVVSYVSIHDVAAVIAASVGNPAALGRSLRITGPEPITALDALRIAEEETGKRFRVQRIPAAALKILSAILRPIAPIPSSMMAMISAPAEPVQPEPLPAHHLHRTTFREYVRAAMAARP
jgi:uncharacterized protein YbjT (DUF2867 family)